MERCGTDMTDKMKNDSSTHLGPARAANRAKGGGRRRRSWLALPMGSLEEDLRSRSVSENVKEPVDISFSVLFTSSASFHVSKLLSPVLTDPLARLDKMCARNQLLILSQHTSCLNLDGSLYKHAARIRNAAALCSCDARASWCQGSGLCLSRAAYAPMLRHVYP